MKICRICNLPIDCSNDNVREFAICNSNLKCVCDLCFFGYFVSIHFSNLDKILDRIRPCKGILHDKSVEECLVIINAFTIAKEL